MTTAHTKFYQNWKIYRLFLLSYIVTGMACHAAPQVSNQDYAVTSRFQKTDAHGKPLATQAGQWYCVVDLQRNLMWEVKTTDGGLRDAAHSYSWYLPAGNRNGGFSGYPNRGQCTHSQCDSFAYAEAVNTSQLCGRSSWRLPTREELRSIVDYQQKYPGPTTNLKLFPNTRAQFYWSSNAGANDSDTAWGIGFSFGFDYAYFKTDFGHIRLVADLSGAGVNLPTETKSIQDTAQTCRDTIVSSTSSTRFFTNADGSLHDREWNLQWMRCSLGQRWSNGGCDGDAKKFTLVEARNEIEIMNKQIPSGWRLPTVAELASISELRCYNPAIDLKWFPTTSAEDFWTDSTFVNNPQLSWAVQFLYGEVHALKHSVKAYVRPVKIAHEKND